MKLFFYYVFHSVKNGLKKLLKTWVLVFFLIMIGGGLILGGTIGTLIKTAENQAGTPQQAQEVKPDPVPVPEEVPVMDIIELAAGGIILLVFVMSILGADKGGAEIFQPADVTLLFPSPMSPQSVLLFRMAMQMGVSVLASVYILFQLPNLTRLGLDLSGALAVIAAWALTLCISQLLRMLCYVTASSRPRFKANLRRMVYAVLLLIVGGFVLFQSRSGLNWWEAALAFFNAPVTRLIPFWGWIKGFVMFSIEKNAAGALLSLGAVLVFGAVLTWLIWHIRADFYEDALNKATEKAELLAAAQSSETGVAVAKRKKDRSERIRRNEFRRGCGANVFFFKSLYNRFRFAHLGFFTKTMEFYLVLAAGTGILCRYVIETESVYPVVLVLAGTAFFRSLGNALQQDTRMWFFHMIPEHAWVKLCWSLAGDFVNCLLDVLPAMLAGLLIQGAPILPALLWLPVIVSVTAYATSVGTFIDLSVNVNAGATLKQMIQIVFIYFGLLPDILIIGLFLILRLPLAAALAVTVFNFGLAALFLFFASLVIDRK